MVPRVEELEEQTVALQAIDLSFPEDMVAQLGARIFVHAPQYHWHTSGTGGIDQEAEMFHPPKIPQQQRNGNGTGFQRVPIEKSLNADVAPVANPFFQPLLDVVGHCWLNGRC